MKTVRLLITAGILMTLGFSLPGYSQYYLEDRWPNLKFISPVWMEPSPDQTKRIFVLEQNGRIKMFKDSGIVNQSDTTTFINLRTRMQPYSSLGETGLLGMAFHPNFSQNGYVFVDYTATSPNLRTIVSRFKVDPTNPNKLDSNSERILLSINQPYSNHNGGSIIFGDDGYLYIAMGDGGSGGDPGNRAQNKADLLGKILRIDVNVPDTAAVPYRIPSDNPFANSTGNTKKEIGCHGMRNPWKISKDPEGPTIWMADVGQNVIEEVDTFRLGANYGWKIMEGDNAYSNCNNCDTSNYEKPVFDYPRSSGNSVTGGYVYRGKELFKLKGAYIYGDYGSQKIWTLMKNASGVFENTQIALAGGALASFGIDHNKEVYSLRHTTGKLMKIRCGPPTPAVTFSAQNVCAGDSIVLLAPTGADIAGYKWSNGDTTRRIVFRNTGTYNVQVQTRNTFGCWSYLSANYKFSINPFPTKPSVADVTGCSGDTVRLFLPSNLNYNWSTGSTVNNIGISATGNYWVFAKDSASCKSDTAFFNSVFYPKPATPVIGINGSLFATGAPTGSTYQWLWEGAVVQTSSDSTFNPIQEGSYQVIVTSANGCKSDTSLAFIVMSNQVSVQPEPLVVSPNPFRDFLEIQWTGGWEGRLADIEVIDMKGRVMRKEHSEQMSKGGILRIQTGSLPKGAYIISVKSGSQTQTRKLVKQ